MTEPMGAKARRTRDHILAQGMELMKEKGFHSTTIRDICEAAEVSVGTFYTYFKDKGDLFHYNFQGQDPAFAEFLQKNILGDNTKERIMRFARYYAWLNIGTGREELKRIFLEPDEHWFDGRNPTFDVLYTVILDGQRSGQIDPALDADRVVELFRVFLRGCVYEWVMSDFLYDLEDRICAYMEQILGFVLKTGA